jgi:putative ABC transport system permease protein
MLTRDVVYGVRQLRRRLAYSTLVVAVLGLGIGANTAMFSVLHAVLFRPLPFQEPSRLVMVWENDRPNQRPRSLVAPANFEDWRTQARTLEALAAFRVQSGTIAGIDEPFHARVASVTPNFFATLQVPAFFGRTFADADGVPPNNRVLILGARAWRDHFGGDPTILERVILYGGVPFRIVGIMPESFAFPDRTIDCWTPIGMRPQLLQARAVHVFNVVGRLRRDASVEYATRELEAIAKSAAQKYPRTNAQRGITVAPLREALMGDFRRPLYFLGAAVALLLVVACANAASLMLAQSTFRHHEMAIRVALGASRLQVARQWVIEGALLSLASGATGVLLAWSGTRALALGVAAYMPTVGPVHLNMPALAYALTISALTGLCLALFPAWHAARSDPQRDLRQGGRGAVGRDQWLRRVLVAAEFAAAAVLVVGALLLVRSFDRLLRVHPGFTTDGVLTIETELPQGRYGTEAAIRQFYQDAIVRLSPVPGVRAVAATNGAPLSGGDWQLPFVIEHRPWLSEEPVQISHRVATTEYPAAIQMPILQGRWFNDRDTPESARVAVINKALADRFFPAGDASGARIRLGTNPAAPWSTIIGVVGDMRSAGPEVDPTPTVFEPLAQATFADLTLVLRASGDERAIAVTARSAIQGIDRSVIVWRTRWLDATFEEHVAPRRLSMLAVQAFAAFSLGLALLGTYGIMSLFVISRTPEIGIRMALGATAGGIHRMVILEGLKLAAAGVTAGVLAALTTSHLMKSVLFDVSPTDPLAFVAAAGGTLTAALLACYLPARRAARVDPVRALQLD